MMVGADPEAADAWWAEALGCTPPDLRGARTVIISHGPPLRAGDVIWVVHRREACIVSVPAPMAGPLSPLAGRHPPGDWANRQFLLDVFRHPVRSVVGPFEVACAGEGASRWRTLLPGQPVASGAAPYARYHVVCLKPNSP